MPRLKIEMTEEQLILIKALAASYRIDIEECAKRLIFVGAEKVGKELADKIAERIKT